MEVLIAIIIIIWSILGIILFFKIWGMTNNIKEIHDWLIKEKSNKRPLSIQTSSFTSHSGSDFVKLSEQAIQTRTNADNFKKGDKVTIAKFGTCIFEGVWQGKYAFYPINKTNLPKSPYLVDDVEPYLLIPHSKLENLID